MKNYLYFFLDAYSIIVVLGFLALKVMGLNPEEITGLAFCCSVYLIMRYFIWVMKKLISLDKLREE